MWNARQPSSDTLNSHRRGEYQRTHSRKAGSRCSICTDDYAMIAICSHAIEFWCLTKRYMPYALATSNSMHFTFHASWQEILFINSQVKLTKGWENVRERHTWYSMNPPVCPTPAHVISSATFLSYWRAFSVSTKDCEVKMTFLHHIDQG